MSITETFFKPLALSIIPLLLGSLIFVGVVENYKDDSVLKVKILEDYFKPSRELVTSCLKRQNELYLQYRRSSSSFRLFYEELTHLIDNPSLNSNSDYEHILKGVAETHFESANKLETLKQEVEKCKIEAFHSLELLSIVTGYFDKFTELSKNRAESLNLIYKIRSSESKANTSGIEVNDLKFLMRSIVTIDLSSKKGQSEFKQKMDYMIPIIEKHSEIMTETEIKMYEIEDSFYSRVREETSMLISGKFKSGFLKWLF